MSHWQIKHRDSEWLKNSANDFVRLAEEAFVTKTPESIACLARMIEGNLVPQTRRYFLVETCLAFDVCGLTPHELFVCASTRKFTYKTIRPCPREISTAGTPTLTSATPQTRIYHENKRPWPKCVALLDRYHRTGFVQARFGDLVDALRETESHALDDFRYELDLTVTRRWLENPHERVVIQTALKSVSTSIFSVVVPSSD